MFVSLLVIIEFLLNLILLVFMWKNWARGISSYGLIALVIFILSIRHIEIPSRPLRIRLFYLLVFGIPIKVTREMTFCIPYILLILSNVIKLHLLCAILILWVNMLDYLLLILNLWVLNLLILFIVMNGLLPFQALRATNTMSSFLIIIQISYGLFRYFASLKCMIFLCNLIPLSILNLILISNLFNVIMGVNLIIKFSPFLCYLGYLSSFLLPLNFIPKWKIQKKNLHNK